MNTRESEYRPNSTDSSSMHDPSSQEGLIALTEEYAALDAEKRETNRALPELEAKLRGPVRKRLEYLQQMLKRRNQVRDEELSIAQRDVAYVLNAITDYTDCLDHSQIESNDQKMLDQQLTVQQDIFSGKPCAPSSLE